MASKSFIPKKRTRNNWEHSKFSHASQRESRLNAIFPNGVQWLDAARVSVGGYMNLQLLILMNLMGFNFYLNCSAWVETIQWTGYIVNFCLQLKLNILRTKLHPLFRNSGKSTRMKMENSDEYCHFWLRDVVKLTTKVQWGKQNGFKFENLSVLTRECGKIESKNVSHIKMSVYNIA